MIPKNASYKISSKNAQTAVEYMLLLMVVMSVVLIGLKTYLPRIYGASNVYFDKATDAIMGNESRCGDGTCHSPFESSESCPQDC